MRIPKRTVTVSKRCNRKVQTILIAVCLNLSSFGAAAAQGEHARRAAVEIQVLMGDIRRLQQENPTDQQVTGLKQRILGSLTLLEVLLRLADNERGDQPKNHRALISLLRSHWVSQDYLMLGQRVDKLSVEYSLQVSLPQTDLTSAQMSNSEHLHKQLCGGCHDNSVLTTERPAYNLYNEAASLPPLEFIARMFNGVRGDASTGLDNPLSDIQIMQLYRYYLRGEPSAN